MINWNLVDTYERETTYHNRICSMAPRWVRIVWWFECLRRKKFGKKLRTQSDITWDHVKRWAELYDPRYPASSKSPNQISGTI